MTNNDTNIFERPPIPIWSATAWRADNIFNPLKIRRDLAGVRRTIAAVERAVRGRGVYPSPVPCLRTLRRREAELVERLDVLGGRAGVGFGSHGCLKLAEA